MPTYVWSDLWGTPALVGAAEVEGRVGIFRYAPSYLESGRPPLDPLNLPLQAEAFRTRANSGIFGVLADAGPDAWGRRVLTTLHPKRMASANPLDVLTLAAGHGTWRAAVFAVAQQRSAPATLC
jgi:serine/threonine-protein kinase HipA